MKFKKQHIAIACIVVVILALSGLLIQSELEKESDQKGLLNYTEIRGEIDNSGKFDYEKQPFLGDKNAPVKLVEFTDFKCPACMKWEAVYFEQFKKDFIDTGKVTFYFMNFAFIDRDSILAASAGEAIYQQSNEKFWEFYQKLYKNQGEETEVWATQKYLIKFVKENIKGIDQARFEKDLKEHTYALDAKQDFKTAGALGINGTPQFLLNGELFRGSYEEMTAAINAALAK